MTSIRQSVCFGPLARGFDDPAEGIAAAAEIGFVSVEMGPEEHWPLVRDHGLDIAIVSGHASLPDGLNNRGNHDRIEAELKESIDKAVEHGIPSLITFSGNLEDRSDEGGLRQLRRRPAAGEGLRRGEGRQPVHGAAQQPGPTTPTTSATTPSGSARLCRTVDSPRIKLLYDIYHMQIMEGDLIRTITDNIEWISHFHTAGNPGRNDPDDTQEIYYPAVMRAIAATGYDGFVGHEYSPKGDGAESLRATFATCDV